MALPRSRNTALRHGRHTRTPRYAARTEIRVQTTSPSLLTDIRAPSTLLRVSPAPGRPGDIPGHSSTHPRTVRDSPDSARSEVSGRSFVTREGVQTADLPLRIPLSGVKMPSWDQVSPETCATRCLATLSGPPWPTQSFHHEVLHLTFSYSWNVSRETLHPRSLPRPRETALRLGTHRGMPGGSTRCEHRVQTPFRRILADILSMSTARPGGPRFSAEDHGSSPEATPPGSCTPKRVRFDRFGTLAAYWRGHR
jgi:hypothetical protein